MPRPFHGDSLNATSRVPPPPLCWLLIDRIKAQQVEFQALKKVTGNTHTARGMPVNLAASAVIIVGGLSLLMNNLYKVCNGKGKIVLDKD